MRTCTWYKQLFSTDSKTYEIRSFGLAYDVLIRITDPTIRRCSVRSGRKKTDVLLKLLGTLEILLKGVIRPPLQKHWCNKNHILNSRMTTYIKNMFWIT